MISHEASPHDCSSALLSACSALFAQPERLLKAHAFPILPIHRHPIEPHYHPDILQLDLALGCRGRWVVNSQARPIEGDTLSVFYPDEFHAYEIESARSGSRILSLKIRVERDWPLVNERVFKPCVARLEHSESLVRAWDRLIRVWSAPKTGHTAPRSPLLLTRLCDVLCLCPLRGQEIALAAPDEIVERVLHFLDANVQRIVSLEEMAAMVHLSPRQLSRRFRAATGQSSQEYANSRRLNLARELLEEGAAVTEVAYSLGFSSIFPFSRWFKLQTGVAPRQIKNPMPPCKIRQK